MPQLRILTPSIALLAAFAALVLGLEFGGAAAERPIDDPGALIRWGTPIVTLVRNLAMAVAFGGAVLACFALVPGSRQWQRTLDVAAAATGIATVGAAGVAYGAFRSFVTSPIRADNAFGEVIATYFLDTEVGSLLLITLLALAALTTIMLVARSVWSVAIAVVLWAVPFWAIASGGHAGGTESHTVAVGALFLHVLFVAIWVGGLAHVATLALMPPRARASTTTGARRGAERGPAGDRDVPAATILARFSTLALVSFVVVAFSGVVSAWIRLGGDFTAAYSVLVLVKSALLVVLGAFGVWQRRRGLQRMGVASTERGRAVVLGWLVAAELAVMGATVGVSTALGRTAPPVEELPPAGSASPAAILTGRELPPPFEPIRLFTEWWFDPLWTTILVLFAVFYLLGVMRLARRGDRWPVQRTVSWMAGLALWWWCTNGALNNYQEFQFSLHMLVHMLLGMAVPVLLVPGAPITLAMRAIAKRKDGTMGGREWIWAIVHSRYMQVVGHPLVSAGIFVLSLWIFYYTPIFEWSMRDHLGHVWMVVHFVGAGYLFVQALIGIDPGPSRPPFPLRLVLLLGAMVFHAFFGLAIMTSETLLLPDWFGAVGNGLDALEDQRVGGGIAWSIGEIPTVILAIVVVLLWTRSDQREQQRTDRAADRDGDAQLRAYNDMLERMAKR